MRQNMEMKYKVDDGMGQGVSNASISNPSMEQKIGVVRPPSDCNERVVACPIENQSRKIGKRKMVRFARISTKAADAVS